VLRVLRRLFKCRESSVVKFRMDFGLVMKGWKFVSAERVKRGGVLC
jgi:hypothetical protein